MKIIIEKGKVTELDVKMIKAWLFVLN